MQYMSLTSRDRVTPLDRSVWCRSSQCCRRSPWLASLCESRSVALERFKYCITPFTTRVAKFCPPAPHNQFTFLCRIFPVASNVLPNRIFCRHKFLTARSKIACTIFVNVDVIKFNFPALSIQPNPWTPASIRGSRFERFIAYRE